jgi:pimeloyl-ACP methyl ester carboxylesterase
MLTQRINFLTEDGIGIIGDLTLPEGELRGMVVLLPMMPATHESWRVLAAALASRRVASLAIDLRGHGESVTATDGRQLDYRQFSDAEHQQSRLDVAAAVAFLRREVPSLADAPLAMAGASIGANLGLRYAAMHPDLKAVAALSPGLDYRGVTTVEAVAALSAGQALWLGASRDDTHGSWEAIHELARHHAATLYEAKSAGHGTEMFLNQPTLVDQLADWLAEHLK